jgi:hypothetical protein
MSSSDWTGGRGAHVVRNEFALVEVAYVNRDRSTSLLITDASSGRAVVLDALELEALTRVAREALRGLLLDENDEEATVCDECRRGA